MNKYSRISTAHQQVRVAGCVFMSLILLLAFSACGGSSMLVNLRGDQQRLNTCGKRNPQPVVVRVYKLRGDASFKKASNESFWTNDAKAIGSDLVDKLEVTLRPGDARELSFKLEDEIAFVGVAADFCQPDADRWRIVYDVRGGKKEISFVLFEGRIALQQN